jgi:hypothetical protein
MVRQRFLLGVAALSAGLIGVAPAGAGTIKFTGDVEKDFPLVTGNDVRVIIDNPASGTPGSMPSSNPRDVDVPQWMRTENKEAGWNFKDIRLYYDQSRDTLAVGVNFFGVGGDVDGNGDPNTSDPRTVANGGIDAARFGGGETVAVGLDFNSDRKPDVVAGIPVVKASGKDGLESFQLAKYNDTPAGLAFGFAGTNVNGTDLMSFLGAKAVDTSLSAPDMEFEITKFSQLAKMFNPLFNSNDLTLGIVAFAAGLDDVIVGEDSVPYQAVSPLQIPEPATFLAWSALAVGAMAARRYRRGLLA